MSRLSKCRFTFIKLDIRIILLATFFLSLSAIASWLDKVERDWHGVKPGVMLQEEKMERLLPAEVYTVITNMALRYQKIPLEPRLEKDTGSIIPGQEGFFVDVETTVDRVMSAGEGEKVQLVLKWAAPRYRVEDLEAADKELGYYQTSFHGSNERYNNIKLALQGLNNTIIWPEQVFSFNEVVGPRTPERGYLPAPIILQGGSGMDYGGGVCQVASTLFNAAQNARLTIVERHQHSRPIGYVPPGRDATVSFEDLDLKLANHGSGPAIIKAGMERGRIWVKITGKDGE